MRGNMRFNISEVILDKILKEKEKEITGYAYEKYKYVDFILFLFSQLADMFSIRGLVNLIYSEPLEYNEHPYKYNGSFSKAKMIVFLLNKDDSYLLWLIKKLIDYDGK